MASERTKPISYLMTEASELLNEVSRSVEPVFLSEGGETKLVLMDFHAYEKLESTLAMLRMLAKGGRDIEHGRFRDADKVMDELLRGE